MSSRAMLDDPDALAGIVCGTDTNDLLYPEAALAAAPVPVTSPSTGPSGGPDRKRFSEDYMAGSAGRVQNC